VTKFRDLVGSEGLDPALAEREAGGLCSDSRKTKPGDIFFAIAGAKSDGLKYVADAAARGAGLVVGERAPPSIPDGVGFLRVADARAALARAASRFFPRQPATIVASSASKPPRSARSASFRRRSTSTAP
jgi:UDP-N-acetylmuramoyl-L-alanyl-D-glutamate--2,6-diaminopimelate ligase